MVWLIVELFLLPKQRHRLIVELFLKQRHKDTWRQRYKDTTCTGTCTAIVIPRPPDQVHHTDWYDLPSEDLEVSEIGYCGAGSLFGVTFTDGCDVII